MDVREKLVELLREVASKTPPICRYDNPEEIEHFGKTITVYCKPFEQFQGLMRDAADYIAHGVTVQEWIPVNDRLPEEKVNCIVHYKHAYCDNDDYWTIGICFYDGEKFRLGPEYKVTHWMPLPAPPKGE